MGRVNKLNGYDKSKAKRVCARGCVTALTK